SQKISLKELVEGYSYETKSQEILVYLGRFFKHYNESWRGDDRKNYRVFHNGKNIVFLKDSKTLARLHSNTIASNYAELVDSYNKSRYGSKPVRIFLKDTGKVKQHYSSISWSFEQYKDSFVQVEYGNRQEYINLARRIYMKDGVIISDGMNS